MQAFDSTSHSLSSFSIARTIFLPSLQLVAGAHFDVFFLFILIFRAQFLASLSSSYPVFTGHFESSSFLRSDHCLGHTLLPFPFLTYIPSTLQWSSLPVSHIFSSHFQASSIELSNPYFQTSTFPPHNHYPQHIFGLSFPLFFWYMFPAYILCIPLFSVSFLWFQPANAH